MDAAATGTVVVVDVIRAFTTAAAALDAGAASIRCVASERQAIATRSSTPGVVLAGERWGLPPPGFDAGNSPSEVAARELAGRVVVLLSQNGTRTLTHASRARNLLAVAAVNVSATATWIARHADSIPVAIVCTDSTGEDRACADHLAALLAGRAADATSTAARVRHAAASHLAVCERFHPPGVCTRFHDDIAACAVVDACDFAMVGRRLLRSVELIATRASDATPVRRARPWLSRR